MVKKIAAFLVFIFVLCVMCATLVACKDEDTDAYVKLSDIKFPEKLDTDKLFGLFFINPDGTVTNSTEDLNKVNYDPKKPLVIFVHGMQQGYGYYRYDGFANKKGVLEAGYNYGVFIWSQPSDTDSFVPTEASGKIWGRAGTFTYADENGKRVKEETDTIPLSIAECFLSYYMTFMERAGFFGREIIFTGHSLGANTMSAISNLMITKAKQKKLDKQYLPDRIVLFDAYWECLQDDSYVDWLGETVGADGVFGRTIETVLAAREMGIATEYVASSAISKMVDIYAIARPEGSAKISTDMLFEKVTYLDAVSALNDHVKSFYWYLGKISEPALYDETDKSQLAFGPNMPLSVSFARNGVTYKMNKNGGISSTNIQSAKIAGFAFYDENGNGINDDRIKCRAQNVKVELYEGDRKIADAVTTAGGYYEFTENLVAGGKYRVKASGINPGTHGDGGYMDNGINSDGYSEELEILSKTDLKIVNIGITK